MFIFLCSLDEKCEVAQFLLPNRQGTRKSAKYNKQRIKGLDKKQTRIGQGTEKDDQRQTKNPHQETNTEKELTRRNKKRYECTRTDQDGKDGLGWTRSYILGMTYLQCLSPLSAAREESKQLTTREM